MFGCPKKDRSEVIPPGYVPVDRINYVLKEIGFDYLAINKQSKIKEKLVDKEGRDTSKGAHMVSIDDLLAFLDKYIHKYADKSNLAKAVGYFDMDGDGQIQPGEFESMLRMRCDKS